MLAFLDPLRELSFFSILFRLVLAILCGGAIGIEREYKCRPAGFRTHILICLGAAMTTLTGLYLWLYMNYYTDVARLGAQVIAGIGFIGAGAIVMTRGRKNVKGLTTAAGLWTAAIVGLACGLGYYEAAVYVTVLILLAETLFARVEYHLVSRRREVVLYVEYDSQTTVDEIVEHFHSLNAQVRDMQLTRLSEGDRKSVSAVFSLQLGRKGNYEELVSVTGAMRGVLAVEEL